MAFKIKDLLKGWMPIVLGKNQTNTHELSEEQEFLRDNHDPFQICWMGPWESDLDGIYEARPMVAKVDDSGTFYAGLQVSQMGGDGPEGWDYTHPHLTKIEAQEAARASLSKWHDARSAAAEDVLEAWQWDGCCVHDIQKHLQPVLQHPHLFPGKIKEWLHTVPEECRGQVSYTASCNPVNSLDEVREYLEIVAVDNSSKEALVCFKTLHTYTDAEGESFVVMPVNEAKALREQFIERGKEEAVEEKSIPQVGAARASSPGM